MPHPRISPCFNRSFASSSARGKWILYLREMKALSVFLVFFGLGFFGLSQETWTLERCIQHARQHNLDVQMGELQVQLEEEALKAAKGNYLPNLNGFASHNYNWGQRIDPFTNQFANTRVQSNSFGLSSDITLFGGFQNRNQVKGQQYTLEASRYDAEKIRNDISLAIASAYAEILFNQELVEISQLQIETTQQQLERTNVLVEVGSVALADKYQVEAQLAREQLNLVQAENARQVARLRLKQLLQFPADMEMQLQHPQIDVTDSSAIQQLPGTIYEGAEGRMPEIKSAELNVYSAESQFALAKGERLPRLSLSGSIGTGYSGLRTEVVSATLAGNEQIGLTEDGVPVFAPVFDPEMAKVPFDNQLTENFNQFVGLSLNVPIFNRFSTSTGIQRASVNRMMAENRMQARKNQLRQDVEQAYTAAKAAWRQYKSSGISVKALSKSFEYAEERFNVGAMNALDYTQAKTELMQAQAELAQARYDFLFRSAILDFYSGRPISFQ